VSLFGKKKEVMREVKENVQLAQDQAAQMQATLRANGYDPDQLVKEAQAAMQSGGANDLLAMSRRAAELMTNGVEMPAIVRTITVGQQSMVTGTGVPVTVGVTVQPPARVPYEAAAQQVMVVDLVNQLTEGVSVTVKVSPDDPQSLMVWGVTGAASAAPTAPTTPAAGGSDRVGRLTKLQSLRAAGAINDVEFEEQKARILAE
jgi:hypothetical protein